MKTLFHHPFLIYLAAGIACLCIMIIVDYVLGAEAEHLNAWVIINRLLGNETGIGDSLAIRKMGLAGAGLLMLASNALFGAVLIQLIRLFIRIIHS
jgi:hypothetical protein